MRAAVAHGVAGRLALADRERAAVVAGRLEHAEADQVDVRDRQRAAVVRRGGEVGRRLEAAEEVRLLEDHRGRVGRGLAHAVGIGRAAVVRHLDDLEPEAARVRLHDLAHLRVRRLGDDDLRRGRSPPWRRSRRRRRPSCRRSPTRSRRPSRSARRSRSGTRRSPAARPATAPAGTACTRSGTRRAAAPRRRPPARSGRRSRRRGTRRRRRRSSPRAPRGAA